MENQSNLIRRNDKVWLKTYEKLGIQNDVNMPPSDTSLIDIVEQNFINHAGKTAFVCMDVTLSYEQLDLYSKQIAAYLQSLGLQKGDKVAVMMTGCSLFFSNSSNSLPKSMLHWMRLAIKLP